MVIKLEINLTNKWLYSIITFAIIVILGTGVLAYNSDMFTGNPQTVGHSGGEINIQNSTGDIVSIQEEITNLQNQIIGLPITGSELICATFFRGTNTDPSFIGSTNGITYSWQSSVTKDSNGIGMNCIDPWIMTGCSTETTGQDEDERMRTNGCKGDTNVATSGNSIRCCQLI